MKVVGTSEEFVIMMSLEADLPTKSEPKSKFCLSIVIKGYFPIALSFKMKVYSLFPSASFTVNDAIKTFAFSDSYDILTSFFCLGPSVPKMKQH